MNNLQLILGGPGCGKTTRLIEIVKQSLAEGISASRIAFVAFTKAAAEEAKNKAAAEFHLDPKTDLPWFRTIHSLAYAKLGLTRDEVMSKKDWKEFSEYSGYQLSGNGDVVDSERIGDQLLRITDYAIATGTSLEQAHDIFEPNFDWWTVEQFAAMLKEFKESTGKVDFSEMLTMFPENCDPLDVEVAIIDEAQDLTHTQWNVVEHAFSRAKIVWVAGDDDQAIYKWAGADVEKFLKLSIRPEVLPISHRLPKTVHALAAKVAGRISKRYEKKFSPTEKLGNVEHHIQPEGIDFSEGSWLILARSNYMLNGIESHIRESGIHYSTARGAAVSANEVAAIRLWEDVRAGKKPECLPFEAKNLFKALDRKPPVFRTTKPVSTLDMNFGADRIWHESLIGIPAEKREYYISCLRRGEKLQNAPRVRIETIHGVKGAEADNVLLMTDISVRTAKGYELQPDNEHRVFYVGITRAKRNLHIVAPQTASSYFIS